MNKPTRYLLDTHIFVWLILGHQEIKERQTLETAAITGGLRVSPVTCWEIGMLASRGRIHLGMPCHDWVEQALAIPGLSLLPLTPRIAVEANYLPGELHGDPSDRMLVASARLHHLTLATRDEKILSYAREGYIQAAAF